MAGKTQAGKKAKSKSQSKAEAEIAKHVPEGERLLAWTGGKTAPAEWMGFLPGFSMYYKMNTKGWVLALTDRRLLMLESTAILSLQLKYGFGCELPAIRGMEFKSGLWTNRLMLRLGARTIELKEVDAADAKEFLKAYRSARKALDLN